MIHLKKVYLLRPSILNLFQKAHVSPVPFSIRSANKFPLANSRLTETNPLNTLNEFRINAYESIANILLQYVNTKSIPWDEVTKKVCDEQVKDNSGQSKVSDVCSTILRTCEGLKPESIGISYCKHLLNENKNLSLFNLFLIMRVLCSYGEKVAEHKEMLKVLLNKFKPYLSSDLTYGSLFAKVLCNDYDCWKDLTEFYPSLKDAPEEILNVLATAAFKFNEYETGCTIWNAKQFDLNDQIYTSYFNYCIQEAKKGTFSTSLIDNLVVRCQKSFSVFPETDTDILDLLRKLVSTLNSDPNKNHVWEINVAKVNISNNYCSNCSERLSSLKITEEEFTKLRDHVLNDVLISSNIYIKTNNKELSKFLSYLQTVKYDVVLDGLNILHKRTSKHDSSIEENVIIRIINYFKRKNMRILFVGRKFVKKFSFFNYIKENCEIFFTDYLSDDDAFIIYAALYGGINTHFFTSDHFKGYMLLLKDEEMKVVFKKWNFARRYSFLPNSFKLMTPKVHSYLPQRTEIQDKLREMGEMCWHFPVGCKSLKKATDKTTTWYCLWRKSLNRNSSSSERFANRGEKKNRKPLEK